MMEAESPDTNVLNLTEVILSSSTEYETKGTGVSIKGIDGKLKVTKSTSVPETDKSMLVYVSVVSGASSCFTFMRNMKIDVVAFIYMFSYVMRSVSSATMIMDKVCNVHLSYSKDICDNLKDHVDIKAEVEKMSNNYHLFHTLIQIVPSALLSCSLGPWSDRYGRKPPLIMGLVGIILDGFGSIVCAAYMSIPADWYLASAVFTGISGGMVGVYTTVYSYCSDITTSKTRTFKFAILEMALGLGMPLGSLAGGWIYKYSGYVAVFSTSVAGHVLGLFFVLFVLEETRGKERKDSVKTMIKNLFSVKRLVESYKAATKKRPHSGRKQIWLLVLSMSIIILTYASTSSIAYMYTHHRYDWGNTKYSTVSAIFAVFGLIVMLIAVPLVTKVLKVGDPTLGIIGTVSLMSKNIMFAFASQEWLYYCANFLGMLSSLAMLAPRSRISKIVPKAELGKVFAFVSTAEILMPVIGSAVFSQIFNVTLITFPGLVYLILGLILILSLGVFIWLAFLPRVDYDELENQQNSEEDDNNKKNAGKIQI